MILEHLRLRRSVTLLAAGALPGPEGDGARRHLEGCARCRADYDEMTALLAGLDAAPVREAEPELPLPVLVALVNQRIDRTLTSPKAVWGWRVMALPVAAAAALLAWLVVPPAVRVFRPEVAPQSASLAGETPLVSDEALARLERNVAREQAVRYLADAQDVLVNVAASPRDCEREAPSTLAPAPASEGRVDLVAESRRSRELLARRTLLVEADEAAVVSARPVLEDVEEMLREVASLEACTRPRDLARLREEMEKRQLLMKMRLMQRELAG
ncbi:MAG TPA: hypothetical protein VMV21_09100 [Vicinamibacteria bacterium]|nr:hypothetical protein [Vicinamibacteria bacterium]